MNEGMLLKWVRLEWYLFNSILEQGETYRSVTYEFGCCIDNCRAATGVSSNIDHQKKKTEYRPNIDHTALYWPNIDRKSSLKSAHLHQKKNEYRPNIDHTALYRPNIDRKSSLKSAHLQYLLLSLEIYKFWENEAFREIWGISEDCFNWGHLGKHCIWTTWILMEYRPFWCNIDHKFKNIDHLSKMVDYRPMVDNIDPVAALQLKRHVCGKFQVWLVWHIFNNWGAKSKQKLLVGG